MSWSAPDGAAPPPRPAYATVLPSPANRLHDAVALFFTLALSVLLGAPAGLAWSALAPHAHVVIDRSGEASVADGASEVFVAGDGWFFIVCVAIGIASGFVAWLLARRSGPYTVLGLALGGLVGAWVASKVGMRPGRDVLLAAAAGGVPGRYTANVALQATQVILTWPIAALATFLALVLSRVDEIR